MSAQQVTDEQALEAVSALKEHGTQVKAAEVLGLARSTFQNRLKRAAERGLMGYRPVLPGYAVKGTTTERDADGRVTREWVRQAKEAGASFAMPQGHVVKGVSAYLDPEGRILGQWIKTREEQAHEDLAKALEERFRQFDGVVPLIDPPASVHADLLTIYPIADQHNGLLAWGRETGESYDMEIGAERLRTTMRHLVSLSPPSKYALVLDLGDWQHTDDSKNMTPRSGNILDVDSRYYKITMTGVYLMTDVIELALQKHEHVIVRCLPGNHDPHACVALTIALIMAYSQNPRVTIIDDPSEFFFHRFGSTLIGAHHGHRAKPDQLAMTMATRCREDWGETKYHYFYAGHIHHETAKEVGDVRVETFQSLAAKDAHHANAGYTSGQSLSAITIHRDNGEVHRHRVNIPPIMKRVRVPAIMERVA